MTIIHNPDGLIGDFLGTIPVMIDIAKGSNGGTVAVIHPEARPLFDLIPAKYGISLLPDTCIAFKPGSEDVIHYLNISDAFRISHEQNLFMSQAHFAYLGLPVPAIPPKAELEFANMIVPAYDYVIAPFSRSLPPQERWQALVDAMPDKIFCIIGHGRDQASFITGNNVKDMYNEPIAKVCNVLRAARSGLISVVSGPSHLAFHLSVKNYLLTNQNMTWGNNPEAIAITRPIPELTVNELLKVLYEN